MEQISEDLHCLLAEVDFYWAWDYFRKSGCNSNVLIQENKIPELRGYLGSLPVTFLMLESMSTSDFCRDSNSCSRLENKFAMGFAIVNLYPELVGRVENGGERKRLESNVWMGRVDSNV